MNKEIRWKQRFENLENAILFLKVTVDRNELNDLEKAGIIKSFEIVFELSWKTLKDFLESAGLSPTFPREVIKEAFNSQLIRDGQLWIQMLDHRNTLSHTYAKEKVASAVATIRDKYFPALEQAYLELKKRI